MVYFKAVGGVANPDGNGGIMTAHGASVLKCSVQTRSYKKTCVNSKNSSELPVSTEVLDSGLNFLTLKTLSTTVAL